MFRHKDKPYHIDYCYTSEDLLERVVGVKVGRYDEWIGESDYMPLGVEFGE